MTLFSKYGEVTNLKKKPRIKMNVIKSKQGTQYLIQIAEINKKANCSKTTADRKLALYTLIYYCYINFVMCFFSTGETNINYSLRAKFVGKNTMLVNIIEIVHLLFYLQFLLHLFIVCLSNKFIRK